MSKEYMQLGHIPSLTWNKLNINSSAVEEDPSPNTFVETHFEKLPEGVATKELTFAQGQKWLEANAPAEDPEHVIAGKIPIYHPQKFATGLGGEFDQYLEKTGGKVEFFEVADDTAVKEPVRWEVSYQNNHRAATEQIIHVGKNSTLTLIQSFRSERNAGGVSAASARIVLEEGAHLVLVKAQLLGSGFLHMDDTGAALKADAGMTVIQMELGGAEVHAGVQAELVGDRSSFEAKAGYVSVADHRMDINYNVVQRGRKTNCQMNFDGVLEGTAQKRLSDTIDFRRGSKGSEGHERENVLLLGGDIVNQSLPVILCEEEDMEGTHGASIGQLDDDMLFYMATRGIDEKTAQQIMVRARLGAVARDIPEEKLQKDIHDFIEDTFAGQ